MVREDRKMHIRKMLIFETKNQYEVSDCTGAGRNAHGCVAGAAPFGAADDVFQG